MSETCKIRTGQVKFQDHKPDWACKIVESKHIAQNKPEFLSLKVNRGRYADPFNQRQIYRAPQTVHNTPIMNILKGYFYIKLF